MSDTKLTPATPDDVVVTAPAGHTVITRNYNSAHTTLRLGFAPVITPEPPPAYDATFVGKGSGNQGAELSAFIKANPGAKLAVSGVVMVAGSRTQPAVRVDKPAGALTTIDLLPGGRLQCTAPSYGILNFIPTTADMVWNGWEVAGSGYKWNGAEDPDGVEDCIAFYGAKRIIFTRPILRDNCGDGIYMGSGAAGIKLVDMKLSRNARNGLGHTAGDLQLLGGSVDQSGLHSLDLEPNNDADAQTISLLAYGLRITNHDKLPQVAGAGYAIGGMWGGGAGAQKVKLDVQNCSFDRARIAVSNIRNLTFKGNSSDALIDGGQETLEFQNCGVKDPATVALFNAQNVNIRNPGKYS